MKNTVQTAFREKTARSNLVERLSKRMPLSDRPTRWNPSICERRQLMEFWAPELEKLDSKRILHWTLDEFHPRTAVVTSFDLSGFVLLSLLSGMLFKIDVIPTGTNFHYDEIERMASMLSERYDIEIRLLPFGPTAWKNERNASFDTENRFMPSYDALIFDAHSKCKTGSAGEMVEYDDRLETVKVFPLARWTEDSLRGKILEDVASCGMKTYFKRQEGAFCQSFKTKPVFTEDEHWLNY